MSKTNRLNWVAPILIASLSVMGASSFAACPRAPKVVIKVPGADQGIIKANTTLRRGKMYYSSDRSVYLVFQGDGNLVLYKLINKKYQKALWDTHTFNASARCAVFQGDGNLVVYNNIGNALWDSFSAAKARDSSWTDFFPPYTIDSKTYSNQFGVPSLVIQNDNNLVIYDGNTIPLWDSGTAAH